MMCMGAGGCGEWVALQPVAASSDLGSEQAAEMAYRDGGDRFI